MNSNIYFNLLTAMSILIGGAVILPVIAGKRKLTGWINFALVTVAALILLTVSYNVIFNSAPQTSRLIDFGFASIYFLIDSFSAFFIAIIAFMAVMSAFYSIEYMEHYAEFLGFLKNKMEQKNKEKV